MSAKPLFIPLLTAYYEEFVSGTKTEEIRAYGPRWNERTCLIGRRVTLSKGYGKTHRLHGIITALRTMPATKVPNLADLPAGCSGTGQVIFIRIRLDPRPAVI